MTSSSHLVAAVPSVDDGIARAADADSDLPPWTEGPNALRHKSERGEVAVWFPAPLVIVYKYRGYTDASHARFIEKAFDDAYGSEQQHIHLFVDTEHQTGYDPEFRKLTGVRALRIEHRTDTYCLLVKSRIIALGIHLVAFVMKAPSASGLTGRISAISDTEAFRGRIVAAVRRSNEQMRSGAVRIVRSDEPPA